jgi:4-amino-4-deoxy-L-arabinose transferase-like glycosyltransferase
LKSGSGCPIEADTVTVSTDLSEGVVDGTAAQRRAWAIWSSPSDQPRWARPGLLAIAVAAALLYSWRAGAYLETYYAAAVRSMSASWHDFVFGAFDPAGTVTLDKLPGAFWIQALSVRLFGVHVWAIVLPQVAEGVLAVLVVYRIVHRLSGPAAGLVAAGVLATAPATVALDRGNISDTLMILLLLLAADSAVAAVLAGRMRSVICAGLWVGLAFQAKMVEAWLVFPALWLVLLVAGSGTWQRRFLRMGAMTAIAVVVSLSWMTFVSLTPATSRPYIDGSTNDSVFAQVFVYNGLGRVNELSPNQQLDRSIGLEIPPPPPPAWDRLLKGPLGRDDGWLLPAALASLVAGLVATRRRPRRDPVRLNLLLWGTWLAVFAVTFSSGSTLNTYYVAALSPAIAGLVAGGCQLAWSRRDAPSTRVVVLATVLGSTVYTSWLLPSAGTGVSGWIEPALLVLAGAGVAGLAFSRRRVTNVPVVTLGLATALVSMLFVPTVASATIAGNRLGSFDTPFQPTWATEAVRTFFGTEATAALVPRLEDARVGAPYLMATESSALAAPFIFETGQEVLPIGGFTGTVPSPTLSRIETLVNEGAFHLVLESPMPSDSRYIWIAHQCQAVPQPAQTPIPIRLAVYYCSSTS